MFYGFINKSLKIYKKDIDKVIKCHRIDLDCDTIDEILKESVLEERSQNRRIRIPGKYTNQEEIVKENSQWCKYQVMKMIQKYFDRKIENKFTYD